MTDHVGSGLARGPAGFRYAAELAGGRAHSSCNRALFASYLLLLIWAPLPLGSNRPWSWALLEVGIFLLGALALLHWAASPDGWRAGTPGSAIGRRPGRWVILLWVLWLAYLGFQMLTLPIPVLEALSPHNARWWQHLAPTVNTEHGRLVAALHSAQAEWLKQSAYVVFFCLTLALVDSERRMHIVIYALIGTATFQAVYGLAAHFMGDSFPFWRPAWYGHHWATGTFINKNHYAAHLSFAIALLVGLCLAFFSTAHRPGWSATLRSALQRLTAVLLEPGYLRFGVLLALLTAFFFSQSRGAFLGLVVSGFGLLLFGAWWRRRGDAGRDHTRLSSAEARLAPWLLLVGLLAAIWISGSGLFGRLLPAELLDTGRLLTWKQSLIMWRDHWLFGIGNGSFEYVFARYRVPALDGKAYDFAHNDHLQLLVEQGVIGAVLFYAALGLCWCTMLGAYCKRGGGSRRGLLLGIMIAVSAFFLHGFVDFNFHIPGLALWFYALLALGLVLSAAMAGRRAAGPGQMP